MTARILWSKTIEHLCFDYKGENAALVHSTSLSSERPRSSTFEDCHPETLAERTTVLLGTAVRDGTADIGEIP